MDVMDLDGFRWILQIDLGVLNHKKEKMAAGPKTSLFTPNFHWGTFKRLN